MKFNKNERFKEIFKFKDEGIKELNAKAIKASVVPIQNGEIIEHEVRDYVLDIDFEERGFKEFGGATEDKPLNELMKYTVQSYSNNVMKVTPNYIINIKNNEIFNIFDTVSRLKFYNFLTDIKNGKENNWIIVTALDKEKEIECPEAMYEIVDLHERYEIGEIRNEDKARKVCNVENLSQRFGSKVTESHNKNGVVTDELHESWKGNLPPNMQGKKATGVKTQSQEHIDLPFQQVEKILLANAISLLGTDESLLTLAIKLKNGDIDEQGIINLKRK